MSLTVLPAAGLVARRNARSGRAARSGRVTASEWPALGTLAALAVTDPAALPEARELLTAELAAVDAACSTFRDDSELVAVNAAARRDRPVRVSPLLAEAIGAALRAADQTGGDVDPVTGPGTVRAPGQDAVTRLRPSSAPMRLVITASASWRQVRLDRENGLLDLPPGSGLDLGATAWAWAADRAAASIAARLGCGVLVSLGGDVAACGEPPPGGWRIRVQDRAAARSGEVVRPGEPGTLSGPRGPGALSRPGGPGEPGALSGPGSSGGAGTLSRPGEFGGLTAGQPAGPVVVVSIRNGGLATAGASAVRWRHGGEVLPHILRPGGGGTLTASSWRLVSVTAASCAEARAASIAAIIRGSAAAGWLSGLGLPARLVDSAGRVRTLAGWPADNVSAGSTAGAAGAVSLAGSGSGSGAGSGAGTRSGAGAGRRAGAR